MTGKIIQVGDKLPKAEFIVAGELGFETLDTEALFRHTRVLILGVPAAFSPTCSENQVPDFIKNDEALRKAGIEAQVGVVVNDAFVLKAWSKQLNLQGEIIMASDPQAKFVSAMGLSVHMPPAGLGLRSNRFCMIVDNRRVKWIAVEDHPGEHKIGTAANALSALKGMF